MKAKPAGERMRLPVIKQSCSDGGVCVQLACRFNTALEVTETGAVKFQHVTGMGEAKAWTAASEDELLDALVDWLAAIGEEQRSFAWRKRRMTTSIDSNCALELIERHGPMEMEEVGRLLGISKEMVYRELRSGMEKLAASEQADELREALLARIECADGREPTQPDHEE